MEDIEAKLDLLLDLYKEDRKSQLQVIQQIAQQQDEMMALYRRPLLTSPAGLGGEPRGAPGGEPGDPAVLRTYGAVQGAAAAGVVGLPRGLYGSVHPFLPHLSHLTAEELKGQSEPSTPVLKTVKPPMHRNLSDLGPRFKKRVTYRCWNNTLNDSADSSRPQSVSSDDSAMPLTPILKKTGRDMYAHQNKRTHPTVQEIPSTTHASPTGEVTSFVTSSGLSPCDPHVTTCVGEGYPSPPKPRSPRSPGTPPYSYTPPVSSTGSTYKAQKQQLDATSPSYYNTFVTSCEEGSPPPDVNSPTSASAADQSEASRLDFSEQPYDYTRNTRFVVGEDSGVSGGEGSTELLLTDSDPASPLPPRFVTPQMYNSTESELISDDEEEEEEPGERTGLLSGAAPATHGATHRSLPQRPTALPTDPGTIAALTSPTGSRPSGSLRQGRKGRTRRASVPTSPQGGAPSAGDDTPSPPLRTATHPPPGGRDRERYRRRPESQPLLMRPEVLKLRKTTC